MRAKEFTSEVVQPNIGNGEGFMLPPVERESPKGEWGQYPVFTLKAASNGHGLLQIKAYLKSKYIGEAEFKITPNGEFIASENTFVDKDFRGKGVAATIYRYAKELGNSIAPSINQTPEGEKMWYKFMRHNTVEENFADGKGPGRKEIDPDVYEDLDNSIIARTARQIVPTIRAKSTPEGYVYLSTQDGLSLVIGCNIAGGSIGINLGSQPMEDASSGPHKGAVTKIISAVYQAAVKRYGTPTEQGTLSIDHDAGHGVWQHIAHKLGLQYDAHVVKENFADGKNPGRKGLSKRMAYIVGITHNQRIVNNEDN